LGWKIFSWWLNQGQEVIFKSTSNIYRLPRCRVVWKAIWQVPILEYAIAMLVMLNQLLEFDKIWFSLAVQFLSPLSISFLLFSFPLFFLHSLSLIFNSLSSSHFFIDSIYVLVSNILFLLKKHPLHNSFTFFFEV